MDDASVLPARHKLTVTEFEQMGKAGIFGEHERIELVGGELIDMAPIGDPHAAAVNGLNRLLVLTFGERAVVAPQNPVFIDDISLPQPDLAVLRDRPDFYAHGRPVPSDVLLLIEVADSSLRFDRTVKLPRYAQAGIPEFWLVDLNRRAVDAYRAPSGSAYREMTTHGPGDRLRLVAASEIVVTLGPIFG